MNARADPSGPVARVLDRLGNVRRSGDGWTARCPAHRDRQNSLSVAQGDDGRVLLTCFAGCSPDDVVKALGLTMADLFPASTNKEGGGGALPPKRQRNSETPPPRGCTLAQYAEAKGLPVSFLQGAGLRDMSYMKAPAVRIPYLDEGGAAVAVRFRIGLEGDDRFRWKSGDKPTLYGLWRLKYVKAAGQVALVEGESDAHTLWFHDVQALELPGEASWRDDRYAGYLDDIAVIYVVVEPDRGGEAVRKWIAASLIRDRVRLVSLGEHKDVSALYLSDPEKFEARWQAALDSAVPWTKQAAEELDAHRREAWKKCETLASAPAILDQFAADLRQVGLVGESDAAKIVYLALTTRLLGNAEANTGERPVSIALKGPSAGGKSYIVEKVLSFFPENAYYALSAMSERALVYSEEPLQHRFIVVYEAAGLQGDFASYLMRSLLSEGRLRYETVEKTRNGMQPRLIEREGPTGLIVTTTALRLHPDNETRLLSITITDTADQTRNVLRALAADTQAATDLSSWRALQIWIEGGERRVVIPYAKALAEQIPAVAVRLRRDFGAVLNLIKAHALLHQASRQRDSESRIIATLDDYAVVRGLAADLIAKGVEATVPETIRETVENVTELLDGGKEEVTQADLRKALRLERGPVSRRVAGAIDRGFLKNNEIRKGRPARLVLGDPMPEEVEILPPVEALQEPFHCSTDAVGVTAPPSPH